jgi:hypothetical protein
VSEPTYTGPREAVIFLRDRSTVTVELHDRDAADEMTRLVDSWQDDPAARCTINGANRSVDIEYRDIVRVDFTGGVR